MQIKLKTLFWLVTIAAFLIATIAAIAPGPRSPLLGYKRARHRAYQQIKMKAPAESAHELLGASLLSEPTFPAVLSAFQDTVSAQEMKSSVRFVTWSNGGNWFYCIGVDAANGNIVFKTQGHS